MTKKKLSGKGTSKKVDQGAVKAVPIEDRLTPVTQMEANMFQNLIQISNQYGKLKQQRSEFELVLEQLEKKREEIKSGKIDMPILMSLGKNKFYQVNNKKEVLEDLDNEIQVVKNALNGIAGQLFQHRDAYIEAGLAIRQYADKKFSEFKPKTPYSPGCSPKKEEEVLFEGELDSLLKDADKKKDFDAAIEKAKEKNKKQ
jgi:hypothetical protein